MPVTINGSTGIGTPGVASTGAVSGTTGTFTGNVTANGVATELRPLVLMTSQASTSGTVIDFTGIPSWAKRITVMFSEVSTSGTSLVQVQIGDSGGVATTGYSGAGGIIGGGAAGAAATTGFVLYDNAGAATNVLSGSLVLSRYIDGGASWVCQGVVGDSVQGATIVVAGFKSLSAALDRVRITTVNGTDTFDAGSINVMYE